MPMRGIVKISFLGDISYKGLSWQAYIIHIDLQTIIFGTHTLTSKLDQFSEGYNSKTKNNKIYFALL